MKLRYFKRDVHGQPMYVDGLENVECVIKSPRSYSDVHFRVMYDGPVWNELRDMAVESLGDVADDWDKVSARIYLQPDLDVCIGDGCCGLLFADIILHNGDSETLPYDVRFSTPEVMLLARLLINSSPEQVGMNPNLHTMRKHRAQKLLTKLGG